MSGGTGNGAAGDPGAPGAVGEQRVDRRRVALTGGPVASLFLVLLSALIWLVIATKTPSEVRAPVVFLFCCLVPGWAVIRLLRLPTVLMEIICSLVVSVGMVVLGAYAMTTTHAWDPYAMVYGLLCFTMIFAIGGLAWQVVQLAEEV